ncbi:MAG: alpha/beta fold hydrolase [Deltaproteobacteria bacterium]|nr:alpha/beta fold hydrolase [Candidatus Zymogenaceae bacterium]
MGLITLTIVLCLFLFVLVPMASGALLSIYLSRPKNQTYQDQYVFTPFETGVPFEKISFVTEDGVELRGWWLPGTGSRAVIGLNGRMGTKSDLLGVGTYLNKTGFSVLLFDYRGCGESMRATMSMGQLERVDAAAAVEYALSRIPGAQIGIIGFSLGASLGLVTAASDDRVRAVVADSPFVSSESIVLNRLKRGIPLPLTLVRLWTRWWTRILYGYDSRGLDVVAAAGRLDTTKLLFVISRRDSVIPPEHQRRVARAAPVYARVWEHDEADHCGAYFADRRRYVDTIISFFNDAL